MNKSPLELTFWYDPQKHTIINVATYTLNRGIWLKKESQTIADSKQPEISQLKNCTAAVTQHGLRIYPWLVVGCDTKYEAAFVCQSAKSHPPSVNATANRRPTCDGDWFMINGSNKCFSVFWPKEALSFLEAHDICSAQNASVFNVDVMHRTNTSIRASNIIKLGLFKYGVDTYFLRSTTATNLYNSFFGKILASDSGKSRLPSMITDFSSSMDSAFFAHLNNYSCSVVERNIVSYLVDTETFKFIGRRGWGVKCRSCSEPLNVTGIICEKDSKPYTINCPSPHFMCNDGTCIVNIYRCDSVTDCFDGSDEDECHIYINNMTNQFVSIPYLFTGLFETAGAKGMTIHSICDGIYTNATLSREEDICYKYNLKQINVLSTTDFNLFYDDKKSFILDDDDIFMLYAKEKQLCLKLQEDDKLQLSHTQDVRIAVPVNRTRQLACSDLRTSCIVKVDTRRCDTSENLIACADFSCPGLFKCHKYYCIYMSSVCDGQYDCAEGDDEIFCPLSSCPGLLKCRGENRCVNKEEICDNTVNCLHSMDDEISCNNCPVNCECSGYSMMCHLENSLEQILRNETYYIKGLIFHGVQERLFLLNMFTSRLVYLNASHCGIKYMVISNIKYSITSFIIIASFVDNKLTEVVFLSAGIFKNIVFLDLSYNQLPIFMYEESFALEELSVLILRGNPLKIVSIHHVPRGSMLSLVDLQHVYHYLSLVIIFSKDLNNQIEVKVSDLLMCCILDQNIKCTTNGEYGKICHGLFESVWSKVTFYSFSVTFFISLLSSTTNIIQIMKRMVTHNRKKYYWIACLNNSISEVFSSLYLFSLLVIDATKVNTLFWTLNPMCLILKLILYISIQTMLIFKTHSLFCVSVQIIYPFKHRIGYLKRTIPMCLMVWFLVSISSFSTFIEELQQDEICSIVKCSVDNTLNILLYMVCVTAALIILSCILIVGKVYRTLEEHNIAWDKFSSQHTKKVNTYRVILKLIFPILPKLPFHVCLFNLLAFNMTSLVFVKDFCRAVFLFILPLNVVWCSLVSIYLK